MSFCKGCGKETDYHFLCNDCVDKEVINGRTVEELYDIEIDAWYASKGY